MNSGGPNNGDGENPLNEYKIREGVESLWKAFSLPRLPGDGRNVQAPKSAAIGPGSLGDGMTEKEYGGRKLAETMYVMAWGDGSYFGDGIEIPVFFTAKDGRKLVRLVLPRNEARGCRPYPISKEIVLEYINLGKVVVLVDKVSDQQYWEFRISPY